MRALITGGAGFIGAHLARRLLADGFKVDLLDDFSRGRRDEDLSALIEQSHVSCIKRDLSQPGSLPAATGPSTAMIIAPPGPCRRRERSSRL